MEQQGPAEAAAPAETAAAPIEEVPPPDVAALEPYQLQVPGTLVTIDMIPVPAGSVTVQLPDGSEQTVDVGPFWISKTEVPWEAYDAFVLGLDLKRDGTDDEIDAASRPSKPYVLPGDNFGHDGRPALGMTSLGAVAFSGWLTYKTGLTYRIPTKAQWVHACRAGQTEQSAADSLEAYAWYWDNADAMTQKVGTLQPNALGVYDMLGNTAEWVVDEPNGVKAIMGGSWKSFPDEVSCTAVQPYTPDWQATDPQIPKSTWWLSDGPFVGLRLIRIPEDQ